MTRATAAKRWRHSLKKNRKVVAGEFKKLGHRTIHLIKDPICNCRIVLLFFLSVSALLSLIELETLSDLRIAARNFSRKKKKRRWNFQVCHYFKSLFLGGRGNISSMLILKVIAKRYLLGPNGSEKELVYNVDKVYRRNIVFVHYKSGLGD